MRSERAAPMNLSSFMICRVSLVVVGRRLQTACRNASISIFVSVLPLLLLAGCGTSSARLAARSPIEPAAELPSNEAATEGAIRFLEARVKLDQDDFIAYNKLGAYYLQRMRETGSLNYLELASRTATASLGVLPPERNKDGLTLQCQTEFAAHEFEHARDHSRRLSELDPGKSYPFHTLGDALLELGDYDGAASAFAQMQRLSSSEDGATSVATFQRLARQSWLNGNSELAQRWFDQALKAAFAVQSPSRETVAWCRWQLGELAFSTADYQTAEAYYNDALTTFPGYFRAIASMGRLRAAEGDQTGAIREYERAAAIVPDPAFIAALGDLYRLAGRDKDAEAQYALVERIGRLSALNGTVYNRQLAMFYADHDMKPQEAYQFAVTEYEVRRDIYGADALAWTALKAGRIADAQSAIRDALRLGTRDARLLYHAGMIARAAGDNRRAGDLIAKCLALNPEFDPIQSRIGKEALEAINRGY
jgi:tetratricopeptide (TPR) repeat protein